jgi:hypothetical protein
LRELEHLVQYEEPVVVICHLPWPSRPVHKAQKTAVASGSAAPSLSSRSIKLFSLCFAEVAALCPPVQCPLRYGRWVSVITQHSASGSWLLLPQAGPNRLRAGRGGAGGWMGASQRCCRPPRRGFFAQHGAGRVFPSYFFGAASPRPRAAATGSPWPARGYYGAGPFFFGRCKASGALSRFWGPVFAVCSQQRVRSRL